jgi:asparagine synthase (glutamine-hydrolysing)
VCGIAGFIGDFGGPDRPAALTRMTATLVHRGPDGAGAWLDDHAALGHRRLAIIDLTEGGAQPMIGASGAVITFNGEIYNYQELRADLEAVGERFHSDSDTEVLLRLFEREGERCLDRLVGMFAFAIWDQRRGKLFIARDRMGKKPFAYLHDGHRFAFASEIKALLTLPEVVSRAEIDPLALSDFLSLGYILTPKTAFKNIRRLPAAHCGWFDPHTRTLTTSEYWRLDHFVLADRIAHDGRAREAFRAALDDAVRLRLRSDVPVGIFLSGGMDSSTVAALAREHTHGEVKAFCVGFAEASYDESPHAQRVADHLGIPLTVLTNPIPDAELVATLMAFTDEPFADTSILPTYLLNVSARRHVTVALTGDGADEILAGYPTYRANQYHRLAQKLPRPALQSLSRVAHHVLKPRYRKVGWDFKIRKFLSGHDLSPQRAHYSWREIFPDHDKRRLMSPDLLRACGDYDPFDSFAAAFDRVKGASFLDQSLYVDVKTWLQDDILVKADRMSMAASLEVRSPFMDHRVVELAAQLAPSAKMDARRQKVILKEIMAPHLPPAIIGRGKAGFGAPTRALGCTHLDNAPALVRPDFHLDPMREDVTYKSFSLAVLGAWLRGGVHADGGLSPAPILGKAPNPL